MSRLDVRMRVLFAEFIADSDLASGVSWSFQRKHFPSDEWHRLHQACLLKTTLFLLNDVDCSEHILALKTWCVFVRQQLWSPQFQFCHWQMFVLVITQLSILEVRHFWFSGQRRRKAVKRVIRGLDQSTRCAILCSGTRSLLHIGDVHRRYAEGSEFQNTKWHTE